MPHLQHSFILQKWNPIPFTSQLSFTISGLCQWSVVILFMSNHSSVSIRGDQYARKLLVAPRGEWRQGHQIRSHNCYWIRVFLFSGAWRYMPVIPPFRGWDRRSWFEGQPGLQSNILSPKSESPNTPSSASLYHLYARCPCIDTMRMTFLWTTVTVFGTKQNKVTTYRQI